MEKMMMGQIDHARKRVRAIKTELLGEAPAQKKSYDTRDMVNGLRSGEVKFTGAELLKFAQEWVSEYDKDLNRYSRPNFESIVLEHAFGAERAADKARFDAENEVYQDRCARVNAEATKVEDAIVLGDQHAALVALQEFAAFKL